MDLRRARRSRPGSTDLVGRGPRHVGRGRRNQRRPAPGRVARVALTLALAAGFAAPVATEPQKATSAQAPGTEDPASVLTRVFEALPRASTDAQLFGLLDELDALAAGGLEGQSQSVREVAYLFAAWISAELEEEAAAEEWLELLRAGAARPAGNATGRAEVGEGPFWRMMQGIEACLAAESYGRAVTASDWALRELAVRPDHRSRVLFAKEFALRATGEHLAGDAVLDEVELELARLRSPETAPSAPDPELTIELETRLHLSRAQAWLSLGVLDRAAEELGSAIGTASRGNAPGPLVSATLAYSDLSLLQAKRAFALQLVETLIEDRGASLTPELSAPLYLQRAVARSELSRFDPNLRGRAEEELRSLPGRLGARRDLIQRSRLELADLLLRSEPTLAQRKEAATLLSGTGDDAGGWRYSASFAASLRARLTLASDPTESELELALASAYAAYDRMLAGWRTSPRRRRGGLGFFQVSYRRMLLSSLIELELAAADPSDQAALERALDVVLAPQAEGSLVVELGGGAVSLEQLRAEVFGPDHGCLLFLPGRHTTHLFAFDDGVILHRALPSRRELLAPIDTFTTALFAPPDRRLRDGGALLESLQAKALDLADRLFDGETRALLHRWKSVTIVGSELLKGLPVECLPIGPQDQLLGLTHAVDGTPSLALSARLAQLDRSDNTPGAEPRVLLVADLAPKNPSADMGIVAPKELEPALTPLLEPFGAPWETELLIGDGASWDRVIARHRGGAVRVLHILAHGAYDRSRELGAALALTGTEAGADRVFAEDIEALGRGELTGPDLVVLSACAAARGPERLGHDNLSHLGGAFLRTGARCVILTRAQILLGRTLRLDRALHEGLAEGLTAAEALRRARVAALDDDPFTPYLVGRVQAYGLGSLRCAPKPR